MITSIFQTAILNPLFKVPCFWLGCFAPLSQLIICLYFDMEVGDTQSLKSYNED